jgi:hypothetical protein
VKLDRLVGSRITAWPIGSQADHFFHIVIGGHQSSGSQDQIPFTTVIAGRHGPGNTPQYIYRGITASFGNTAFKHDMAVND